MKRCLRVIGYFSLICCLFTVAPLLEAQTTVVNSSAATGSSGQNGLGFEVRLSDANGETDFGVVIQLLVLMSLLSIAPGIIMLMTSFLRIIIVLGFLRSAMGLQTSPPNQILVGLAAFLTFFLMMPVGDRIYKDAIVPLQNKQITSTEAMKLAAKPLSDFMLKQTRPSDIEFFLGLSQSSQVSADELPMSVLIPSFVMSELRTAFQMGFLLFLPFLVVDFVVATVLMSMGMMMMPPVIVSLPFKILLFVLVDGWYLLIQSLVTSF
jgi:flagellar biosynthetic protein FliP